MTIEEQTSHVAALPDEGLRRRPWLVERADPAAPPDFPSHSSQHELVSSRNMVERLSAAYPSVDAVTVEVTVRTAYNSFHQARVRAYVPILAERRSRRVLRAADRTDGGAAPGPRRAHPGPAKG
jgi:hypothetical protein